jgi:hypothetical protein
MREVSIHRLSLLRKLLGSQLSDVQFNAGCLCDTAAVLRNIINRTACTWHNFELPFYCNVADSGSRRYVSAYHDSIPACSIRLKQQQLKHDRNNQHVHTFHIDPVTSTIAIAENCLLNEQRRQLLRSTSRSGPLDGFVSRNLGGGIDERHAPTF